MDVVMLGTAEAEDILPGAGFLSNNTPYIRNDTDQQDNLIVGTNLLTGKFELFARDFRVIPKKFSIHEKEPLPK